MGADQKVSSPMKASKTKGEMKKSVINHSYRDYSHVEIADLVYGYKGVNEELFPSKIHMILSSVQFTPYTRFPLLALLCTLLTFTNNLQWIHSYLWFTQRLLREGPDQNAYYHELFLCGRPEVTSAMTRLISPGKRLPK